MDCRSCISAEGLRFGFPSDRPASGIISDTRGRKGEENMFHHQRIYVRIWAVSIACTAAVALATDSDGDGVPDGTDVCCSTPAGIPVNAVGRPIADLDNDCDVDMSDFGIFQTSMTGPMTPCNASPEVCDGVDNDCNCIIDDVGTQTCGTGVCQVTVQVCINGVPQSCTPGNPSLEVCDGLDNDCDGMVDESLINCNPNCPGNPQPEVCNSIDDNCDGFVDENLGVTTCGTGAC